MSRGVECRIERFPLGVVASITPFNFPSMVPNWTIPNAIALGNCLILKPSEMVPLSANRIAELLAEAGLPQGVFQVVHGRSSADISGRLRSARPVPPGGFVFRSRHSETPRYPDTPGRRRLGR